jgi:hypothetical protein
MEATRSIFERNMAKVLARVAATAEVTMDLEGYTPAQRDIVIAHVEGHGMRASFDGRFLLIRN